jgi:uncharacterized coiled-coil DUF342 family protein
MKRDDTKETTINVGIIRDRKEQTLSLTLPERKRSEMREESLDVPDMNAQVKSELDQARVHVAELRPDMMKYAEQIKRLKPEMEKMAQEVKDQQEEIQKNLRQEMENLQEELHDQQKEYQELIHQTGGGADI